MDKAFFLDFVVEVVRSIDHEPGFKVTAAALGGRAQLRLDHPLASAGARL
jgi:hypothetical protein